MAWYGQIVDFKLVDETWFAAVEYYDDSNPDLRILRSLTWPLGAARTQMIADIKAKGTEIKNYASINTANIVGQTISIP